MKNSLNYFASKIIFLNILQNATIYCIYLNILSHINNNPLKWYTSIPRVCSKHLFRSMTWQKSSILNWVLKLNLQKKICANKSRFYCFFIKKKTSCDLLSIFIFSHLTCTMKDEIDSQVSQRGLISIH